MMLELFTYITTRCSLHVRRMGYLYEAIGLSCRYKRHSDSWLHHLEKTRQFVLSAAGKSQERGKVVILGSGLLLDVPIETLSSMFREVVLIDIVCLPEVYRRIKGYNNVRFIQQDVTNIAESLYQNVQHGRRELPSANPVVLPKIDNGTGLVISLNILSQLTVVPRKYALKKLKGIPMEHINAWCRQITEAHYDFIMSLPYNVCLIADYRYTRRDRNGRITAQGSTISGISLPVPDDSWTWNIAPLGEESRHYSKELDVGAWHRCRGANTA